MRYIWKNGEFLTEDKAVMSVYDSGVMSGHVFEMSRSFLGQHFKLEEHIDRLFRSMKVLDIVISYSKEDIVKACNELSKMNVFGEGEEHRLLIIASKGILNLYSDVEGVTMGPYIMITDFPLRWTVQSFGPLFDSGLNLILTNQKSIPSRILDNKIKHHNRLHSMLANIEVSKYEGENNWPLFTDENGFITECPGANIIVYKDEKLYTPTTKETLDGISLNFVREIETLNRYDVFSDKLKVNGFEHKNLQPYDILNADEVFVTATPFCILPVTSLNGIKIGNGKRGEVYNKILKLWSELVGVDIEKQIKSWYQPAKSGISPYGVKK